MRNPCCCNCASYTSAQYVNVTKVPDYAVSPDPDGIYPYPKPSGYVWSHGGPGGSCQSTGDSDCPGGSGLPVCGQWTLGDVPTDCDADLLRNKNCFHDQETNTTVTVCVGPGHKVVQAWKNWHGHVPFDYCGADCDDIAVRYLQITYDIQGFQRDNDEFCTSATIWNEQRTFTVDRFTGIVTLTAATCNSRQILWTGAAWEDSDPVTFPQSDPGLIDLDGVMGDCNGNKPGLQSYYEGQSDNLVSTYSFSGTQMEWHTKNGIENPCSGHEDDEWVEGDTAISSKWDVTITLSSPYYGTEAQRASASGDYSVEADCKALLAKWWLTNGIQYPWRADGWRGLGPQVHYNESGANSLTIWTDCDYTDPDAATYDGSILGLPFEEGESATKTCDKTFSWFHPTFLCCRDDASCSDGCWEQMVNGASSGTDQTGYDETDAVIPPQASDWTNNYDAGYWYAGSFAWWTLGDAYNEIGGQGCNRLNMQKQCEAAQDFDAYNLFGPCGSYRHQMDTRVASCIIGWSGDDIQTSADLSASIAADDDVIIWNGRGDVKRYPVTGVSGVIITVGAEDANARNAADAFDENWDQPGICLGDFGGILGLVRKWKRGGVQFIPPPICGKIRITGILDNEDGTVTVTLASEAKYLQIGDRVLAVESSDADTVYDDNSGAGYEIEEVVSGTQFKFTATYDAGWIGKYLKSLVYLPETDDWEGAPLAKFNSTAARGEFDWQQWANDAATGQFDATPTNTADKRISPRRKTALGSTPNTDTDTTWDTDGYTGFPFPTVPDPTACGGRALVIPIQCIINPLWLPPATCTSGDTSSCDGLPDIEICPPYVEAMKDLTGHTGAPALPDDCSFGLPTTPPVNPGLSCADDTSVTLQYSGQLAPWIVCIIPS